MKRISTVISVLMLLSACAEYENSYVFPSSKTSLRDIAGMISSLPLGEEQLNEVHDAVSSSTVNGYDEEYTMEDLFNNPGAGVGDDASKAAMKGRSYSTPLRDLITEYLKGRSGTKSGMGDIQEYIDELMEGGYQIYWPYSDEWDGESMPIITFDPGFGADSNYGYELKTRDDGSIVVDSVYVDENVAMSRPVWVINHNNDSAFTPMDFYRQRPSSSTKGYGRTLMLHSFTMLRNYDSWFAGASEFIIRCGSVSGLNGASESDLEKFRPSVTDFVLVVKRRDRDKEIPLDIILVDDFSEKLDKLAFLITEDDGGTTTSWKCAAVVKFESKSYGFDCEFPYKDKDDIVWRGQMSTSFFTAGDIVSGRFGDVRVSFSVN